MPRNRQIQATLKKFGDNVRRERTSRSITQEKLAERADLNIRTVQKIEAGQVNILVTTLLRIQQAIGCALSKLL